MAKIKDFKKMPADELETIFNEVKESLLQKYQNYYL